MKEALIVVWEASDRICSKRLKAILPDFVEAMERYGHIKLDHELRHRLLLVSASTIDIRPHLNRRLSLRKQFQRS